MELSIGKVISEFRKKNNITQEQIADAVGVSVPAVSKWETGNSYPDITLLIPIARYLGMTVDELLNYECDISAEKVLEIEEECVRVFEDNGYEEGVAVCNSYIKEYPNNLYLKMRIAGLFPWYADKKGKEQDKNEALEQSVKLLKKASESKDEKIRNASLYFLACDYIGLNKSDDAKNVLEQLPKIDIDPNKLLPTIYMQQGDIKNAVKINQQNLISDVSGAVLALTSLTGIAVKEQKWEDAIKYADAQRCIIKALELDDFMLENNCQLYISIYSHIKDAEKTIIYLKEYFAVFPYDVTKLNLSENFFFSMASTKRSSVALNITKETLIKALEQDKNLDFLRNDKRFKTLIDDFKNENIK